MRPLRVFIPAAGLRAVARGWMLPALAGAVVAFGGVSAGAGVAAQSPESERVAFFSTEAAAASPLPELRLEIAPADMEKLRQNPRGWVPCVLFENGVEVMRAGVKIKGSAGSLRSIDDRPALSINTRKFNGDDDEESPADAKPEKKRDKTSKPAEPEAPSKEKRLFHGMERFALNNSVQDESLLNEWVCTEILRNADYPATRVTHARVSLNGRDLGMYVLKEGFDKGFIQRNFGPDGVGKGKQSANLYDGGFLQDVTNDLERDMGKGPLDRQDLRRIAAACWHPNQEKRWEELEKLVDIEMFLRFVALERLMGHWDGYTQNRNNYRIYVPPPGVRGGKAIFLPHGMDQTFTDPGFPVLQDPAGMVAVAVMSNPAWKSAYRKELSRQVAALNFAALQKRIEAKETQLQQALKKINKGAAAYQLQREKELVERMKARIPFLVAEAARPEPKVLEFKSGEPVLIDRWADAGETPGAVHDDVTIDGAAWKRLVCPADGGHCVASWRRTVLLPRGHYTLSAEAKAEGVEALPEEWPGRGAGVRVSGGTRSTGVAGNERKTVSFEFDVNVMQDVVLVMELRAAKGSVAFRADSIKLTRSEIAQGEQPRKP